MFEIELFCILNWIVWNGTILIFNCLNKKNYTYTKNILLLNYTHHHHHHHHVARISLTLSRHFSLSFIASGRSSGLHPVFSHSCWMYVRAGRPAFARPYVGVHRSTSLMSSSLLLQQCPACLVRLTWIVFVMDDLHVWSDIQVFQSFHQYFGECTECTNYHWYPCHLHVPLFILVL